MIRDLFLFLVMQTAALDTLKAANTDGCFWIKLDATDVKVAVMESGRRVWNGDEDLGDGQLQKLRQEYDERYQLLEGVKNQCVSVVSLIQTLPKIINQLDEDIVFLDSGLSILRRSSGNKIAQRRH